MQIAAVIAENGSGDSSDFRSGFQLIVDDLLVGVRDGKQIQQLQIRKTQRGSPVVLQWLGVRGAVPASPSLRDEIDNLRA
jgi:hypothetical protein